MQSQRAVAPYCGADCADLLMPFLFVLAAIHAGAIGAGGITCRAIQLICFPVFILYNVCFGYIITKMGCAGRIFFLTLQSDTAPTAVGWCPLLWEK